MQKLFVAAAIAITALLALKTPTSFTVTGKLLIVPGSQFQE